MSRQKKNVWTKKEREKRNNVRMVRMLDRSIARSLAKKKDSERKRIDLQNASLYLNSAAKRRSTHAHDALH